MAGRRSLLLVVVAIVSNVLVSSRSSSAALSASLSGQAAPLQASVKPSVADLDFFLGRWSCAGRFVRSGKAIEADVSFEKVLEGKWILFRHDDRPPFSYHAIAEWSWSEGEHDYVASIQDSTGGLRLFHSPGWRGRRLTWTGSAIGSQTDQQFEFERMTDSEFKVSYSTLKDGKWIPVDTSVCKRLP